VSLAYTVASNWGSGFTDTMTLKAGSSALSGWTAEFNSTASITNIWNATIVSHVGDHYVVRNVDGTPMADGQTTHAVMPPAMAIPMVTTSFTIVSELCTAPT